MLQSGYPDKIICARSQQKQASNLSLRVIFMRYRKLRYLDIEEYLCVWELKDVFCVTEIELPRHVFCELTSRLQNRTSFSRFYDKLKSFTI